VQATRSHRSVLALLGKDWTGVSFFDHCVHIISAKS
jgi:hypothetical protein